MSKNLIVVGELHQDLFYRTSIFTDITDSLVKSLSEKNPSLSDKESLRAFLFDHIDDLSKKVNGDMYVKRGGNGNNSAEALSKLNVPVRLMTTVGLGVEWMYDELKNLNIETDLVFKVEYPTPISTIIEDPNITKILVAPNAKEHMNFADVQFDPKMFAGSTIIFFTPMADKYTKVLEFIENMPLIKAFTLELQKITTTSQFESIITKKMDIMFANLNDAAKVIRGMDSDLTDEIESRLKSVDCYFARFSRVRVYTLGKFGSWICIGDNGKRIHISSLNVKVVNRTGAGDTFAAGFLAMLFNEVQDPAKFDKMDDDSLLPILKTAGEFGTKASALKISSGNAPTFDEVNNFAN
jgi:sugar/nucleoside kinase (ribokinase family)